MASLCVNRVANLSSGNSTGCKLEKCSTIALSFLLLFFTRYKVIYFFPVLEIEPRTSYMLGKHFAT
jgi:hypothetical protein